jgi:tetratricopeptide (TPR) repeat protein
MRVLLRVALLGTIAMTLYPVLGRADPVTEEVKAKANDYVNEGLAAQSTGDYDVAIGFYSRAYQLVPHPALLFNIAQAHRLAGRIEQALALYERYLEDDPGGAKAKTARELIAEIKARKAEEARRAEEARKAAEARKAEETRKAAEARNAADARDAAGRGQPTDAHADALATTDTAPGTADRPPANQAAGSGRGLRAAGVITGSAGVMALAVGTGFGLRARSLSNELSRFHGSYSKAKEDAGRRDDAIALAGWIGGAALVGVGATLYWLGYSQRKHGEGLTLVPSVSEQSVALLVSGPLP